jgi:hypothetical protein
MKNFIAIFLTTILVLTFLSCGKKGNVLPPLVRFPQTAENVQIVQIADQIVLTWQNPIAYEDGSALSVIENIEIWILEEIATEGMKTSEMSDEEFERVAKLHMTIPGDRIQDYAVQKGVSHGQMVYVFKLSGKDFLSKKYTFGFRVKEKKRFSSFSVLVSLQPMVLPMAPTDVAGTVFPDRIEVKWNPPLKNRDQSTPPNLEGYNIYRSEGEEMPRRLNVNLVIGEKYNDKNFSFGQIFRYFVRASATSTSPFLESEDSDAIEISAEDTFAPDPPKGLISVAGQDVLSITWDANGEVDLDGYRVWRRDEGSAEVRLLTPDLIKENAYNDKSVKKGTTYMYFVTALDKSGNESHRSEAISDRIREMLR